MKKQILLAGNAAITLTKCQQKPVRELTLSGTVPAKFRTEANNAKTFLYSLTNKAGRKICIAYNRRPGVCLETQVLRREIILTLKSYLSWKH